MEFSRRKNFFIVLIMMAIFITGFSFVLQDKIYFTDKTSIVSSGSIAAIGLQNSSPLPPQKLSNPPEIVKAVYVTGYSAGSKKYLDYLSNLFKNTEINAVVVDIKDYSGLVSYNSDASNVKKYNLYNSAIRDINGLVRFFHDQNIYVIGRIVVFQDPAFAKARPDLAVYDKSRTINLSQPILWKDNKGLSWLDPASEDVWDYNISLAKDAFSHGFDEINFDYVRFPSDGKTQNMGFPLWNGEIQKSEVIREFFQYTRQKLADDPPSPPPSQKASDGQGEASAGRGKISVDLFGQTTVAADDMGVGQLIEDAFENFDYISPMVYPSHYANGFIGFSNPAEHPYEVVKYSMDSALNREKTFFDKSASTPDLTPGVYEISTPGVGPGVNATVNLAKFRPWLQDFDIGADYNADMVKAEIKATQDALGDDFNGFMLWNPSNIYTIEAVLKPR